MLRCKSAQAARAACKRIICSVETPLQTSVLSCRRQLPHSGCRCTTHSIVHSNADKAVPTATRLPSVQHSSQIPMLQQYSRHSNLAVCGSTSGSLSGPRQAPHLGRSVRSSRRLCRRDYPSPAAVMACISSCAHHESTYIIKARPPPPAAAEAGALSIPWNSSLHSFGAPVNPSTARGYSVTTAAGGLSSLDTESTYSDDETTSGEQDSGGLPWYYDEMVIKDNWAATDEEVKFWTAIGEQMKRYVTHPLQNVFCLCFGASLRPSNSDCCDCCWSDTCVTAHTPPTCTFPKAPIVTFKG